MFLRSDLAYKFLIEIFMVAVGGEAHGMSLGAGYGSP